MATTMIDLNQATSSSVTKIVIKQIDIGSENIKIDISKIFKYTNNIVINKVAQIKPIAINNLIHQTKSKPNSFAKISFEKKIQIINEGTAITNKVNMGFIKDFHLELTIGELFFFIS